MAVVNPRNVRDFAKASGRLAKTDKLDARCIAHFAAAMQPSRTEMPDETTLALEQLLARRRQLMQELVAEKNRRPRCSDHDVLSACSIASTAISTG